MTRRLHCIYTLHYILTSAQSLIDRLGNGPAFLYVRLLYNQKTSKAFQCKFCIINPLSRCDLVEHTSNLRAVAERESYRRPLKEKRHSHTTSHVAPKKDLPPELTGNVSHSPYLQAWAVGLRARAAIEPYVISAHTTHSIQETTSIQNRKSKIIKKRDWPDL